MMVMMLTQKDKTLLTFLFKILYFNVFGLFVVVHLNLCVFGVASLRQLCSFWLVYKPPFFNYLDIQLTQDLEILIH